MILIKQLMIGYESTYFNLWTPDQKYEGDIAHPLVTARCLILFLPGLHMDCLTIAGYDYL